MSAKRYRSELAGIFLVLVGLGTLTNPFARLQPANSSEAYAAQPFTTVVPVQPDFDDPFTEEVPQPVDLENFLLVGDLAFPIGDEFLGEPDMELAGIQQDPLGRYGLATISESPDYRLIWTTDRSGQRHNIIVHKDDPLYSGENGFLEHYDDYSGDLLKMGGSMGVGITGAATLAGLGFAGCVPSLGAGCVVAIVGASVSLLGGLLGEAYFGFFEVQPAMDAMDSLFSTIDSNRGSQ